MRTVHLIPARAAYAASAALVLPVDAQITWRDAEFDGFGYADGHASVFEAACWVFALVFNVKILDA